MARQSSSAGKSTLSAIIMAIMGVAFLFMGLRNFIMTRGELLDFNTASKSEITDGTYVEGTFTYSYGAYCENTETRNGVFTRTTGYYYLQDVCENSPEGQAYFIGVKVSKSDSEPFDNLTYSEDAEPVTIKGRIREQSAKISGFMDDYIEDMFSQYYSYTLTDEDLQTLKDETLYYYIDIITPSDYIIPIAIGAGFLVFAIIPIISSIKKKKKLAGYSQTYGSESNNNSYNQPNANGYDAGTFGDSNYNNTGYNNSNPGYNNNNNYNNGNPYNNPYNYNGYTPDGNNAQPNPAYVDPFLNTGDESTIALNDPSETATVALDETNSFKLKN
ncbi:MAG: DUF6709 family protein [Coprococcus sp.]